MSNRQGWWTQIRARTRLQQAALFLLVPVDVGGITAIVLGHRDLGRSLVGLGVVAGVAYMQWVRTTRTVPRADQVQP